jgi:hypothetical protein
MEKPPTKFQIAVVYVAFPYGCDVCPFWHDHFSDFSRELSPLHSKNTAANQSIDGGNEWKKSGFYQLLHTTVKSIEV